VRRLFRRGLAASSTVAVFAVVTTAAAEDPGSSTYFSEGQRLMKEGKYAEACPQFEKALALNPGAGTKFNLAECYEKTGKPASALGLFREVENVTRQVGQRERSAAAKERADSLEARTPTVIVRAPWTATLPGAVIFLDGKPVTFNDVEKPLKVDLGRHEALARNGTTETRADAVIEKEGESKALVLAAPRDAASSPAAAAQTSEEGPTSSSTPPPPDAKTGASSQRTIGLVVGGIGVAALGVGSFLALGAKGSYDRATEGCGTKCPADQATRANDARTQADIGGGVMIVGAAALIGGVVLFLTAPRPIAPAAQ
jgi:hypothetical protein